MRSFRSPARGATLVEYALGVALIGVVLLIVISGVEDGAGDRLEQRGDAIGHPTDGATSTSTSTSTPSPSPSSSSTSTTAPTYNPTFNVTCSGPSGSRDTCLFGLNPAPPATPTWSILPSSGFDTATPIGNDFSAHFTAAGTFTIRATVNSVEYTQTLNCRVNGRNLQCS